MLKKSNIYLTTIIAITLGFILSSCENLPGGPEQESLNNEYGELLYIQTEMSDLEETLLLDGTIEEQFDIELIYGSEEFEEASKSNPTFQTRKFGRDRKFKKGRPLGKIFRELSLNDSQKESLKQFFEENKECASEYFQALRENSVSYRENANQLRDPIIDALKAGDLTRDEAKAELEIIRNNLKEEMLADEDRQAIIDSIKACREELHAKIASILDDDQRAKWEAWLAEMEAKRRR